MTDNNILFEINFNKDDVNILQKKIGFIIKLLIKYLNIIKLNIIEKI